MKKNFYSFSYKSFFVAAGLLLAFTNSNGQIAKTDLNPDVTITQTTDGTSSYEIDIDGNGVNDFSISIEKVTDYPINFNTTFTGYTIDIAGLKSDNEVLVIAPSAANVRALSAGDLISSMNSSARYGVIYEYGVYKESTESYESGSDAFGNSTDKYLGVKFIAGVNKYYYGYIGINTSGNSFTIRDFAYEQLKDAEILAGSGNVPTSISNSIQTNTTIKNVNNVIVAEFENSFNGQLEVVNLNGQVVNKVAVSGNSSSINMIGSPSGIYQVVISGDEGYATKKIYIQ